MGKQNPFIFQNIPPSHPELPAIIALSIGNPTPEKMGKVLGSYGMPNHHLIGCFDGSKLIGMIGFEVCGTAGTIKHIAVLSKYQQQGIGKALIKQAGESFCLQSICAETDEDTVGFYEKLGFNCQPFEGYYGKRYNCEYK